MSAKNNNKGKKNAESAKTAGNQTKNAAWEAFEQRLDTLQKLDAFNRRFVTLQNAIKQDIDSFNKAPSDTFKALNEYKQRLAALEKEMDDLKTFRDGLLNPSIKAKTFANYDTQIQYLKKRHSIENDRPEYRKKLRSITYYRLKGYLLKPDGNFLPFETACQLHEFDARMRAILFYAVSKVELYLRAQFSYVFCDAHCKYSANSECKYSANCECKASDPYAYLKAENYSGKYKDVLDTIQKAITRNKPTPFVKHYIENYGNLMPLWVVTELLEFGGLVTLYKSLNWKEEKEKEDVGEKLLHALYGDDNSERYKAAKGYYPSVRFISWLESCNYLRNACAHGGRLYNRKFSQLPSIPNKFQAAVNEENKQFLWGAVLALQFLYPNRDEWSGIVRQIKSLLDEFALTVKGGEKLLLSGLGFPNDWANWLCFWWHDEMS